MATVVDPTAKFKHFCRVCKKGFGCGRALGGHMRAHGIGDEFARIHEELPSSDGEGEKLSGGGNKRMYALRTNPNRLKSCRSCENCGKDFSCWKSFLEHGKCTSADVEESLVESPGSEEEDNEEEGRKRDYVWSKGKRSRRTKFGYSTSNSQWSEEEDLAHCLIMLSTARVDPLVSDAEESCASASREEERHNPANALLPSTDFLSKLNNHDKAKGASSKGVFECKACKKVFNSHQALGGHRASHKKVKGCFAANVQDLDESTIDDDVITSNELTIFTKSTAILQFDRHSTIPNKKKSKGHECSICHRMFSSGQALGGHKRCHWLTSNTVPESTTSTAISFQQFQDLGQHFHQRSKSNKSESLDLNLPASINDGNATSLGHEDHKNSLTSFKVPTEIFLQPWIGVRAKDHNINMKATINGSTHGVNDEDRRMVKLSKLSDLKDTSLESAGSPWLQVGIGSTVNMGSDP